MSVRLSEFQLSTLQALATIDDETVGAQIRRAVESYIAARLNDPGFAGAVNEARQRQDELLARILTLGDDRGPSPATVRRSVTSPRRNR